MAVRLPPPELLADIFETSALLLSDSRAAQQRWLWQASSTSAALVSLVSSLALRHVHVFRADQVQLLAAKLAAQPHLSRHIRKLEIDIDCGVDVRSEELVDLVTRCAGITDFVLRLQCPEALGRCRPLEDIGLDLLPALRTLGSLESFVCHNRLSFDVFADAAASWPRLSHLHLFGGLGSFRPSAPVSSAVPVWTPFALLDMLAAPVPRLASPNTAPTVTRLPRPPPPFALRSFNAGILAIEPAELEWLFSTSAGTLSSFALHSAPAESYVPCAAWLDLLAHLGPTLESIVFRTTQIASPSIPRYLDRVVASCPRLVHLDIAAPAPALSPDAAVLRPLQTFGSAEWVERLSVAASFPVGVVPALIGALVEGELKRLRRLEVTWMIAKDRDEASEVRLREVCAERGIDIGFVFRPPWTLS
jgi:hypothetical protein